MAERRRGLSARWKLTLSYTGFLLLAGAVVLGAMGAFLYYSGWLPRTSMGAFRLSPGVVFARGFAPVAAWVFALLLVFGLAGGWWLAGRMLAPLGRVTAAVHKVTAGSIDHRIDMPGRQDEFRELADTFDSMLTRLAAHVAEQQRFAANASHELRTPLAISKTLLDVAAQEPPSDPGELIARLQATNSRAIELTEALLQLSRAERRSFARERVDLSLLAEEAVETLLPLAEGHGVTLAADGEAAAVVGSPALLAQLTTNLVHNAIVHNLPEAGEVRVTTAATSRSATLTVTNTGESLDPDRVATLAEPFQRGTDRVISRADGVGLGLGLAIVRAITASHDGTLTIEARDGGGLRVVVTLPVAVDSPGFVLPSPWTVPRPVLP